MHWGNTVPGKAKVPPALQQPQQQQQQQQQPQQTPGQHLWHQTAPTTATTTTTSVDNNNNNSSSSNNNNNSSSNKNSHASHNVNTAAGGLWATNTKNGNPFANHMTLKRKEKGNLEGTFMVPSSTVLHSNIAPTNSAAGAGGAATPLAAPTAVTSGLTATSTKNNNISSAAGSSSSGGGGGGARVSAVGPATYTRGGATQGRGAPATAAAAAAAGPAHFPTVLSNSAASRSRSDSKSGASSSSAAVHMMNANLNNAFVNPNLNNINITTAAGAAGAVGGAAEHQPQTRHAVALTGANTAAANASNSSGVYFSGTKTSFTAVTDYAGEAAAAVGQVTANTGGAAGDANDEEVDRLLRELERSVEAPCAMVVMRDATEAIEARALTNFDPMYRDLFLEQRLRDTLAELSRVQGSEAGLLLAARFIEALLPVPYTSPPSKFTRLCRSLFMLMQCGREKPAREAQRVYRHMLELDQQQSTHEPPLKNFVSKELKDTCELALMQLHGRLQQQSKTPFQGQYLYVMLLGATTAEASPRYVTAQLRGQIAQLATLLAGNADRLLRATAYECLVALYRSTSDMRLNEIVIESRRACDEAMRQLNTSQSNEGSIVSSLAALRALLWSRGLHCVDKQSLPQLCVLVTEQMRISKSPLVRAAVCDLIPIIAPVDIGAAPRRSTYCATIMEPVKNVRDERGKAHELDNVAQFIEGVGFDVLDASNKTNLDSIVHRYASRPETQEACWHVLAAICSYKPHQHRRRGTLQSQSQGQPLSSPPGSFSVTSSRFGCSVTSPVSTPTSAANVQEFPFGRTPVSPSKSMGPLQSIEDVPGAAAAAAADKRIGSSHKTKSEDAMSIDNSSNSEGNDTSHQHHNSNHKSTSNNSINNSNNNNNNTRSPQHHNIDHTNRPLSHADSRSPSAEAHLSKEGMSTAATVASSVTVVVPPTVVELIRRCVAFLEGAALTAKLVEYVESVQQAVPSLRAEIEKALDRLVELTLRRPDEALTAEKPSHTTRYGGALHGQEVPLMGASPTTIGGSVTGPPTVGAQSPVMSLITQYFKPAESPAVSEGTAPGSLFGSPTSTTTNPSTQQPPPPVKSDLRVALSVFARCPVTTVQQLEELKGLVMPYQRHEDAEVRLQSSETVITCLSQWVRYAKDNKTSTYSTRVTEVLESYVKNAQLEVDPVCQLNVISLLTAAANLRPFLSEQRILSALLSFLGGSQLVRERMVELLVAITQEPKPTGSVQSVQQSLYVTIESSVVVLEYTNETRTLIRSLTDLQTFTRLCVRPLSNHLGRIFYALRKKLNEVNSPDVVTLFVLRTLETILSSLVRNEKTIFQYQDDVAELYGPVVKILKETSSPALCHAVVNALVWMNRMCTVPEQENIQSQQHLVSVLTHVYTGMNSTREELLNILTLYGQIGAVDPSVNTLVTGTTKKKNEEAAVQDEADLELTYDYTVIVYRTLSRMLDVSLSEVVCSQALRTLLQFIRYTQDRKELVGGVHAVRAVVQVAKKSSDSPALRIEALHVLAAITTLRHERIALLVLPEIVVLLEQLWIPSDHALFRCVLEVVSSLKPGKLSGKEQSESWAWLYPRLVDVALQDHTESREFSLRVVEIILNASYIPPHCIPIVFPMLIQFVQQSEQLVEVRGQSLCAAVHIVCELKAVQYFSTLLHGISTLTRHCNLNEDLGARLSTPGVRESLKVLAALHPSGRAVIKELRDCLTSSYERNTSSYTVTSTVLPPQHARTSSITSSGGTGTNFMHSAPPEDLPDEEADAAAAQGPIPVVPAGSPQEIALLMKHIEWGLRVKEDKLREWFAELQKLIILVSPSPAFRMMVDLFDKHEPLRRELFHPSFKSLYETLTAEQMKRVNDVLTVVLNCNDSELSGKCLTLADYLDHNQPNIKPEVAKQLRSLDHRVYAAENDSTIYSITSANSSHFSFLSPGEEWTGSHHAPPRPLQATQPQPPTLPRTGVDTGSTTIVAATPLATTTDAPRAGTTSKAGGNRGTANTEGTMGNNNNNNNTNEPDESAFDFDSTDASLNPKGDGATWSPNGSQSPEMSRSTAQAFGNSSTTSVNSKRRGAAGTDTSSTAAPGAAANNQNTNNTTTSSTSHAADISSNLTAVNINTHRIHHSSSSGTGTGGGAGGHHLLAQVMMTSHIPFQPNALFSTENIVKAAEHTNMYDKAISYMENKVHGALQTYRYSKMSKEVIQKVVWPLAWLYSQREMHDSVVGLFRAIHYQGGEDSEGFGYELLRWWEEAQWVYAKSVTADTIRLGTAPSIVDGYVRTLCFCGEWDRALETAKEACFHSVMPPSSSVATCGAMAAWLLGKWEDVSSLAECITERNYASTRLFYLNSYCLHNALKEKSSAVFDSLRQSITQSKLTLEDNLRTLLPISYAHAYESIVMLQHFTEMDEVIDYCQCRTSKARRQLIERWAIRFKLLKRDSLMPSFRSLMLHSLVLNTSDMSDTILHFCQTMGRDYPRLTHWAMCWLRQGTFSEERGGTSTTSGANTGSPGSNSANHAPYVMVGYITHIWGQGHQTEAIALMEKFLADRGSDLVETNAECYGSAQLKLGRWKQDLHADSFWKKGFREDELVHFHKAIRSSPSSYEAWHSWGLMNYRVQQRDHNLTPEEQHNFVEAAHQGFVAAICRCKDSSEALPGVMRLLQLWVIHNGVSLLKETVADSISRIPVDHWVLAIPQLIGHLSHINHDVREVISMILRSLCQVHPQAVVFPLLVVVMSDDMQTNPNPQLVRKRELVHSIVQHCQKRICNEAETVAKLLVDVSAIPIEKIRENLSQVATAWNPNAEYEEDTEEVVYRLQNTMDIFQANLKHLLYTVGNIGKYVQGVLEDYKRGDKERAATIVGQLVDEITKHVTDKLGKEPQKALEPLLRLRNLSICVFGEYDFRQQEYPTIASFSSKLDVIPSKKRPRRVQLNGSDGCLYSYCLKGNEDIRMDERVMQLFGMVNVLLNQHRAPSSAQIHRFPVIPISSNVGLLGWVENANTINNTICNYRNTISNVRTHHEATILRNYVSSFGQWEKLSIIHRTEVLDFVMNSPDCEAIDISRAMWHRANSAEQWIERRNVFTTSLATMSMVGYVLGLGDRHLGNILLSMSTGKIVHIDFGDSFDVGRLRHVLPETIPFRLTRMLTNAMEVFGVDGVFRASATNTQTILQKNRDSIMALLSAFVYDPIVQYKGKMKNMMEKSRSPQDVAERIRNKLRGTELAVRDSNITPFNTTSESCKRPDLLFMSKAFDDEAERDQTMAMGPEEQVGYLIQEAVRTDNYTTLYFGWGPLW